MRKVILDKENINNIKINKILLNKDIEIIKEIYLKYYIKFLNWLSNFQLKIILFYINDKIFKYILNSDIDINIIILDLEENFSLY